VEFLGDFHLHSRFSRATSRQLSLPHLHGWAQRKGIHVIGTGDLTHPDWCAEMREVLVPAGDGVFEIRPDLRAAAEAEVPAAALRPVRFLLTGEISNIYKQEDKTRKIHTVVFAPDFETVDRINAALDRVGNLKSDGRPILGITARDLLEIVLEAGHGAFVVPAHIWTPWFSLLGSRSGFDSVEACFGDLTRHVFAVETGLSADPPMCRRLSILDGLALVSNSDAHSGGKLGREANVFDTEPDFPSIRRAWETNDRTRFKGTIEFFPEEGKYHYDGHRKCEVRLNPAETRAYGGVCPVCGKPLTCGVMSRVEELADREADAASAPRDSYETIVPLTEVLAEVLEVNPGAKKVRTLYDTMLHRLGPEIEILRNIPLLDIERASTSLVAEAIRRMREGDLRIEAGYDGEFGTIRIFSPGERARLAGQGALFAVPEMHEFQPSSSPAPGLPRPTAPLEGAAAASLLDPAGDPAPDPSASSDLNEAQRTAVEAPAGPLIILAGPGTGKTRTLTQRIAHRIRSGELAPDSVLAVTFTNRAAEEMRERVASMELDAAAVNALTVCTFHALGLRILRAEGAAAGLDPGFRVVDGEERDSLLRRALEGRHDEPGLARARQAIDAEGAQPPSLGEDSALRVRFEACKRRANVVDYDDLIRVPLALFMRDPSLADRWRARYRFLCIDEYQDLNPAQYALVRCLASADGDITVIGDPDQAIYGFRGASPSFFLEFENDFRDARVVRLTRNYRSTEQIVSAASQVIARSPVRWETRLRSGRAGAMRIAIRGARTPQAEAEAVVEEIERLVGGTSEFSLDSGRVDAVQAGRGLSFADIAILFRLQALRRPLEEALGRSGMPFQAVGHEAALDDAAIREAAAALRSMPPRNDATVAEHITSVVEDRRLRDGLVAFARPFATDLASFLDHLALCRSVDLHDPRAERISLLTLHASKGMEFPVVFMAGIEEDVLPFAGPPAPADLEEERRLLYVGMTRARSRLYLSYATRRTVFGRKTCGRPSRFLDDIEEALKELDAPASLARSRRRPPEQKSLFESG